MIAEWILRLPWVEINYQAKAHGVKKELVASIVSTESNGDTCAIRYEPDYRWLKEPVRYARINRISMETEVQMQKTSFGLMQIMGATARDLGYSGPLIKLCDPIVGLEWGIKFLKGLLARHQDLHDAIASYNAGSPRRAANGEYVNQVYVDIVTAKMQELGNGLD